MKNLKLSIASLLLSLTMFFNLDALDFGQAEQIGIHSFVYGLGLAAVLTVILIPMFSRYSVIYSLLFWNGALLVFKLFAIGARPIMGGLYTYLTLSEMALISLLVILAYRVGRALHEYMRAVEFVTVAGKVSKSQYADGAFDLIHAEMNRSRHNDRGFSLILASLDSHELQIVVPRLVTEAQETLVRSYVITRLAETLRNELRRMDIVLEDHKNGRVLIVSPEVDEMGSAALLQRLSASVNRRLGVQMKCGAASFPHRALTIEDLFEEAECAMGQNGYYQYVDSSGVAD